LEVELLPAYRKIEDQRYGEGHGRRRLVHSQPDRALLFTAAKSRFIVVLVMLLSELDVERLQRTAADC
jgi:hypothetical protein